MKVPVQILSSEPQSHKSKVACDDTILQFLQMFEFSTISIVGLYFVQAGLSTTFCFTFCAMSTDEHDCMDSDFKEDLIFDRTQSLTYNITSWLISFSVLCDLIFLESILYHATEGKALGLFFKYSSISFLVSSWTRYFARQEWFP